VVIPGLIFVLAAILTGYTMAGGKVAAVLQPAEYVTILGAAIGAEMIMAPMAAPRMVTYSAQPSAP
jgi:chemotaxis protein MotA